jgi:hypothetical protein
MSGAVSNGGKMSSNKPNGSRSTPAPAGAGAAMAPDEPASEEPDAPKRAVVASEPVEEVAIARGYG